GGRNYGVSGALTDTVSPLSNNPLSRGSAVLTTPGGTQTFDRGPQGAVPARRQAAAVEDLPDDRRRTILLVEDEAPVRAFANRALRLHGYEVIEADSGERALEILADPALAVDLFVTDVVMPGLDGPSWVREALRKRVNTPVIFMSGYMETPPGAGGETIPGAVFLAKPFSLSELAATVAGHLAAGLGQSAGGSPAA
ncbi:MAG TPA: response regulator, partial [Paracoccus solventivorans]|uniref:response regulator n=1 Tax=Paracoccus solventivorans TaxID=53463 RepID=UPI002B621C2F